MTKPSVFYEELRARSEEVYRRFTCTLIPGLSPAKILGVRIPLLRRLAKQLLRESPAQVACFFEELPHFYYEENNLHGLLLAEQKEFGQTLRLLDAFLPHVDNWATCDLTRPAVFKKKKSELLPSLHSWLASEHEYTLRFAIGMLLTHYLDEAFRPDYLETVASLRHQAYYVKMMMAWYFAEALAKQYGATLPLLEQGRLEPWTHNMAIQKAKESRRISAAQKEYLVSLRRR